MRIVARDFRDARWLELEVRDGLIDERSIERRPGRSRPRGRLGRTRVLGHPGQRAVGTLVLQSRFDRRASRRDRSGSGPAGNGPALSHPDHRAASITCCTAFGRSPPPARRFPTWPRGSSEFTSRGPSSRNARVTVVHTPPASIRDPDWSLFQELQEASGGRIVLMTLAPERTGAIEFIRRATAAGVVIALGHTAADAATIRAATEAGARLSTHLGNGIASRTSPAP